jgi:hypothetical protein
MSEKRIKGKMVYTGLVRLQGGGLSHRYYQIDENEKLSKTFNLYSKKLSRGAIGAIIDIEFSEDLKTVYFSKNQIPSSFLKDRDQVAAWRGESEAIETKEKQDKILEKESLQNPFRDKLEILKTTYKDLHYKDRPAYLANIIEYITR